MGASTRTAGWTAAAGLLLVLAACAKPLPPPIQFSGNRMSVVNQTSQPWTNVEVWMNNHYRVTLPRLEAGQRFDVPLDAFVAGNGHRFQPKNQSVTGVQVLAKSADGSSVKIDWGKGRQWY